MVLLLENIMKFPYWLALAIETLCYRLVMLANWIFYDPLGFNLFGPITFCLIDYLGFLIGYMPFID